MAAPPSAWFSCVGSMCVLNEPYTSLHYIEDAHGPVPHVSGPNQGPGSYFNNVIL